MELDGSNRHVIGQCQCAGFTMPRWVTGDRVVTMTWANDVSRLYVIGPNSVSRLTKSDTVSSEIRPAVSRDGVWVYFASPDNSFRTQIWRTHFDGSGLERVSAPGSFVDDIDVMPDGNSLIVAHVIPNNNPIARFDLNTRSFTDFSFQGTRSRAAPTGDRIAYMSLSWDAVHVANIDGSNPHELVKLNLAVTQMSWTRDGQWILVQIRIPGAFGNTTQYVLVRASTGEVLPLPFTRETTRTIYLEADIRP
jgi:Tol biopolymer transport system component